jgi:hypothetical protein
MAAVAEHHMAIAVEKHMEAVGFVAAYTAVVVLRKVAHHTVVDSVVAGRKAAVGFVDLVDRKYYMNRKDSLKNNFNGFGLPRDNRRNCAQEVYFLVGAAGTYRA